MKPLISIIIVSWNGKKWLKGCFDSLARQTFKNFEIVFVDNNSTDGTQDYIQKYYPEVRIVQNHQNLGFGVANNIGVKKSKGEILFLLNNDTKVFPNTLEKLLEYKNRTRANIIGPRLLNEDRKDLLEGGYSQMDILGYSGRSPNKLFYVGGSALMISKKDFNKIGGFDEKYFMYGEESDFCWRALLYGMTVGVCEETKTIHFGGGTSSKTEACKGERHITSVTRRLWSDRHILRTILKNYSFLSLLWILPLYLIASLGESLIYIFTGNLKMFSTIWQAIGWNLINFTDTMRERKIVQNRRAVSDLFIFSKMYFGSFKLNAFLDYGMPRFKS